MRSRERAVCPYQHSPELMSGPQRGGARHVPSPLPQGRYHLPVVTRWGDLTGQEIEPPSWTDCAAKLLSWGGVDALYRGHRCFDWELQSSIERALLAHADRWDKDRRLSLTSMGDDPATEQWALAVEDALTQRFRQRAMHLALPELPEAWDILGWWEVMQHHGAPTRLMDWTTSPFTALWFAVDQHDDARDGDMALWVYDRHVARMNIEPGIERLKSAPDYTELDDRQLQNRLVKLALHDGSDLLIPVRPRQFPRAVAQQSILTVSPNIGLARPARSWVRTKLATRVRLKQEWKPEIQAACESMGLSRLNLFRDLDSLGEYICQIFMSNKELPASPL